MNNDKETAALWDAMLPTKQEQKFVVAFATGDSQIDIHEAGSPWVDGFVKFGPATWAECYDYLHNVR